MTDLGELGGHQRVAAFLLSLDAETATKILRGMKEEVVSKVAEAMIDLDPRLSAPDAVDALYRDLALALNRKQGVRACDQGELVVLLEKSLGRERSGALLEEIRARRQRTRPFHAIEGLPPAALARALQGESAAVTALVLAHLDPSASAAILDRCERSQALEIVRRMATLTPPGPKVLQTIAAEIEAKIATAAQETAERDPSQRLKSLAELLNHSSPEIETNVLAALAEEDAAMAAELREYLFTWEDIATVDKRSMQKILGSVDTKTLSIALKACSPEVEENVLLNLSTRVREMVAEERELAGPMPMSEVSAARDEIMRNIRAMIEAGEFRPHRGGEDLVA